MALAGAACGDPPTAPRVGPFTVLASLLQPRANIAAAMLTDGRILIIGGTLANGAVLATAEIFDPVSGTMHAVGCSMSVPRRRPIAITLADGRVLVMGGDTGNLTMLVETEIFDPATGCFVPGPALHERRFGVNHAVRLRDNRVLVVLDAPLNRDVLAGGAEVFDPATNQFTLLDRDLGKATEVGAVVVLSSGRVLLAGGYEVPPPGPQVQASSRLVLFDPGTDTFHELNAGLSDARSELVAVADSNDGAYLIGGGFFSATDLVEYFHGPTRSVATHGRLLAPRLRASAIAVDRWVLVLGGRSQYGAQQYLHATSEWIHPSGATAAGPPLAQPAGVGHHTFRLPDGRIAIVRGAEDPSEQRSATIQVAKVD